MIATRFRGGSLPEGKKRKVSTDCDCGSGRMRAPQYSKDNKFLFFTCNVCHATRWARYKDQQLATKGEKDAKKEGDGRKR